MLILSLINEYPHLEVPALPPSTSPFLASWNIATYSSNTTLGLSGLNSGNVFRAEVALFTSTTERQLIVISY